MTLEVEDSRSIVESFDGGCRVIMGIGDAMEGMGKITVLFIAGFGPIVREPTASRKLYNQTLGIGFKEENGGYLHTEALQGAKTFALWPLSQAAESCFGTDAWPTEISAPHVIDARTLPRVQMPNRNGFVVDPRPDVGKKPK